MPNSNRFNPSPRAQRMQQVAETILTAEAPTTAQPKLALPEAVKPEVAVEKPSYRIALFQGPDVVSGVTVDEFVRKTPESSLNAGLYGKVQIRIGKPLSIQIGTHIISGGAMRQFTSGNYGWYFNAGKLGLLNDTCQCGGSVTVSKSKDWTAEQVAERLAEGKLVDCQLSINTTVIHSKGL